MAIGAKKKSGLRIIIVGLGKVGATLAEQLSLEDHDVTVIDRNAPKVQAVADRFDVMGMVGNGASYSMLVDAGIDKTDLLIAVTESDELNLLCCTLAKQVAGCSAIARVRTPDYSREADYLSERLGLAMILNPDQLSAHEIARILYLPSALEINAFAHHQAESVRFRVPEGNLLDGMEISRLGREIEHNILVCGVERGDDVTIPNGGFRIQKGDIVSIVGSRTESMRFLRNIGLETQQVANTLIIGGGRSAYYLASRLLTHKVAVTIVERSRARCEELSDLLPDAVIINGDGTDAELLKEVGIERAESFVPLTGIDEENVLLTLHARKVSKAKLVTKINRMAFRDVIDGLDLGSVVYPRYLTSEAIIAYVRALGNAAQSSRVISMFHMFSNRAEALEMRVEEPSEVTNVPLKELHIKPEVLIGCINRGGRIIIPGGDDSLQVGDTVVIVTRHKGFDNLRDMLER